MNLQFAVFGHSADQTVIHEVVADFHGWLRFFDSVPLYAERLVAGKY